MMQNERLSSDTMANSSHNDKLDHGPYQNEVSDEIQYQPFIADLSKDENILSVFYHMYKNGKVVDFKLKICNDTISCHKTILYAKTEYFQTLFDSDFKDSTSSEANLEDFDPECVRKVIEYCYTGKICCAWEEIENLLDVVCYLGITKLLESIDTFVRWKLTPQNAVHWFEETSSRNLVTTRRALFNELLTSIHDSEHFRSLSLREITSELTSDNLRWGEVEIFAAAWMWWSCDKNMRLDSNGTVFDCVRFEFLAEYLDSIKEIIGDEKLLPINLKKYVGLLDNDNDRDTSSNERPEVTTCMDTDLKRGVREKIANVHQRHHHYVKDVILIETYDKTFRPKDQRLLYFVSFESTFPLKVTDFPFDVHDPTLCVTPRGILFSGGREQLSATKKATNYQLSQKVYVYDIYFNLKLEAPDMMEERYGHTCVMVGAKMFVIGGSCYERTMNDANERVLKKAVDTGKGIETWRTSVLCLDTYNMNWTSHSMIPLEMEIFSSVVVQKSIYILCRNEPAYDCDDFDAITDMFLYLYDTEFDTWEYLTGLTNDFNTSPCLFLAGNKMYMTCALMGEEAQTTVSCYVYDIDTKHGWTLVDTCSINGILAFTPFVLHGKLLACTEAVRTNACTYRHFDVDKHEWRLLEGVFPANISGSWTELKDFPSQHPRLFYEDILHHASLVVTPKDERIE